MTTLFNDNMSIDDMFIQLPISQIKQLSHEYNTKIASTKSDLHCLVGRKYRDLIKIAEDIDCMFTISQLSDQHISNLSYQSSKFVSFTSNNYSKFDSGVRARDAQLSRLNSRAIIVRNIINKKLAKLDYKIRQGERGLIHTSNFIYYSKVFYTIERTFPDVLESNKSINTQFSQMKTRLVEYLESEVAGYNLTNSIVHSANNDKFKLSQRLNAQDLVMNGLQDDYIEDEFEEDEELEEEEDRFENYEFVNSKIESYDVHTSPISNYLISLTILHKLSFSKFVELFVDIRYKFLQSLIEHLRSIPLDKINFFKIFKYIENTICYIEDYFTNSTSDYFRGLLTVKTPWNASNLIGHRSWFDDTTIHFDLHGYEPVIPMDLTKFLTYVFEFVNKVSDKEVKSGISSLSCCIFMFHNVISSLVKLQDSIELSGINSHLINMISKTDHLSNLLSLVTSQIQDSFDIHISQLNTKILETINDQLSSDRTTSKYKMFTNELVTIMDDNIDEYMKIISNTVSSSSSEDAGGLVYSWFDEYLNYTLLVSTEQIVNKLDVVNCVSHLSSFKRVWGQFTDKLFTSEFGKLKECMSYSLWKQVEVFVNSLNEFTISKVDDNFYLIGIISRLKDKLPKENQEIWSQIEKLCFELFQNIVNDIPNDKFDSLFKQAIEMNEVEDIPLRPSLKMISAMFILAKEYSRINEDNSNYNIFVTDWMRLDFTEIKNKWIREKLIAKLVEVNKGEELSASLSFLVDYIFLLEFCTTTIDKSEISKLFSIEESIIDIIIQGVNAYYKSNKNIYLPLSL